MVVARSRSRRVEHERTRALWSRCKFAAGVRPDGRVACQHKLRAILHLHWKPSRADPARETDIYCRQDRDIIKHEDPGVITH